jgi:hypothetical protein
MAEIFDDLDQAIHHSYMSGEIAWLEVGDLQTANRLLVRLRRDVTINNLEVNELVLDSRPVIHVSGKIIESDFQLYLVWLSDTVTKLSI